MNFFYDGYFRARISGYKCLLGGALNGVYCFFCLGSFFFENSNMALHGHSFLFYRFGVVDFYPYIYLSDGGFPVHWQLDFLQFKRLSHCFFGIFFTSASMFIFYIRIKCDLDSDSSYSLNIQELDAFV